MRVALVSHNVVRGDGQGRVNYEIARHLLRRGHSVYLVADRVDPELIESGAILLPVHARHTRADLIKVLESAPAADRALRRIADRVDVIHGHGYALSRRHHVNTSHFVHSTWRHAQRLSRERHSLAQSLYQGITSYVYSRLERKVYRRAKLVVAISDRVRCELQQIGVDPRHIRVIPNGVDIDEFRPGPACRSELGLPEEKRLALFVGDIRSTRKNLATALHALARTESSHLAVVGDVTGSPYPAMADALGIAERVHFLGFRRDVANIMRACDVLVSPAYYEPFSLVVLEAMASGLPVIVSGTVGASELITPECGIVVQTPSDIQGLAAALHVLFDSPAKQTQMGQAGRAIAERYTWGRMAEAYVQVYGELAA